MCSNSIQAHESDRIADSGDKMEKQSKREIWARGEVASWFWASNLIDEGVKRVSFLEFQIGLHLRLVVFKLNCFGMKSMYFNIWKHVFFEILGSKMIVMEFEVGCDVFILKCLWFWLILTRFWAENRVCASKNCLVQQLQSGRLMYCPDSIFHLDLFQKASERVYVWFERLCYVWTVVGVMSCIHLLALDPV